MFLHHVNYSHFSIARGDTLLNPRRRDDEPFDTIVAELEGRRGYTGPHDYKVGEGA